MPFSGLLLACGGVAETLDRLWALQIAPVLPGPVELRVTSHEVLWATARPAEQPSHFRSMRRAVV